MNWDAATVKCVVCGKRKQYGRKIQFFRFPNDSGKCRSWVKVIGKRELLSLTLDELHDKYVCEIHFPPECINHNANRLHKVALPTLTTQLPLDDDLLSGFPTNNKTELGPKMKNIKTYGLPREYAKASTTKRLDQVPTINYERPLMTCLETLIHNDIHYIKKPAGILNTISVPLLTYSSSMEVGTVFAATGPENLPFVVPNFTPEPTIPVNRSSLNRKTYSRNKNITLNASGSGFKAFKKCKKATVRPYEPIPPRDNLPEHSEQVLANKTTQIACTDNSNIDMPIGMIDLTKENEAFVPTTLPISTIDITEENEAFVPGTLPIGTMDATEENEEAFVPDTLPIGTIDVTEENEEVPGTLRISTIDVTEENEEAFVLGTLPIGTIDVTEENKEAFVPGTLPIRKIDVTKENEEAFVPTTYTNTEIIFVPYTAREVNVTPDEADAHIGGGTLVDFGLPLMNCVATMLNGNAPASVCDEDPNATIDIPLMNCFKTLEHNDL